MVPMASFAWNSAGIIDGSCSASSLAATGDFNGKLRVKWFWLIGITFALRDHAAVKHLVQNRRGDLASHFPSNANTRFQSFFMSTTVQPSAWAASSALSSLPTEDLRS